MKRVFRGEAFVSRMMAAWARTIARPAVAEVLNAPFCVRGPHSPHLVIPGHMLPEPVLDVLIDQAIEQQVEKN